MKYCSCLTILLLGFLLGCSDEKINLSGCHHGKVILLNGCSAESLISVKSDLPIGKKITIDNIEYSNVIKVPGLINKGSIYFTIRDFNRDADFALFTPYIECFYVKNYDVPLYVITAYNTSNCP